MTATLPLLPTLAQLAAQAEATDYGLADAHDALPEAQRAAWRRILAGLAKGEGLEEWIIAPVARGLAAAGLDEAEVTRFFATQGVDELRHRDLFLAYLARHYADAPPTPILAHKLLYDGLFRLIIAQSERRPLRLLLPLLAYEKCVSAYLTRLIACAEGLPTLTTAMKAIRQDEARHVAGVGLTCRALVARKPPGRLERALLRGLVRLVIWDMDRAAWWKPGLAAHMGAVGLDAAAMRAENEAVARELFALVAGG